VLALTLQNHTLVLQNDFWMKFLALMFLTRCCNLFFTNPKYDMIRRDAIRYFWCFKKLMDNQLNLVQ